MSYLDDSDNDKTFKPSRLDANSSNYGSADYSDLSTDSDTPILELIEKAKKDTMSNDTLVGEDNVEVIKSLSKKQATARSVVHNIHMKRLNDILASNGLIRAKISADGNCFFNATVHQIKDMCNIMDTAMLRQEVCNHLMA